MDYRRAWRTGNSGTNCSGKFATSIDPASLSATHGRQVVMEFDGTDIGRSLGGS